MSCTKVLNIKNWNENGVMIVLNIKNWNEKRVVQLEENWTWEWKQGNLKPRNLGMKTFSHLKYMEQNAGTQNFLHIWSYKSLIYTTDYRSTMRFKDCYMSIYYGEKIHIFGVETDTMRIKTDLQNYQKLSRYWYCMQ